MCKIGSWYYTYEYDEWGNLLNDNPYDENPFRYRGYYYDSDTGLYYCGSRYYDPSTGRFISPDDPTLLTTGHQNIAQNNLYAYCWNNPITMSDDGGRWPAWASVLVGAAVIGGLAIATVATGGAAAGVAGFILGGALKGALIGAGVGIAGGAIVGAANHRLSTGSWDGAGEAALVGASHGFGIGAAVGALVGAAYSTAKVGMAARAWGSAGGRTPLQNMTHHYGKHIRDEGHTYLGRNIVQYTNNAKGFFTANQGAMKLTSSGNYVIRAMYAGHKAGGFFSQTGVIFSFF